MDGLCLDVLKIGLQTDCLSRASPADHALHLVRGVKRIQLAPCRKVASNLVSDLLLAQGALRSVAHYPRELGPAPSLRFTACR